MLTLDQVYTIKIANGDEIVAKVVAEDVDTYTVIRPLTVIPGREGINMVNSLFTVGPDEPVTINKSQVALYAVARQEVCDSYLEATTGIKPVRNKILMG
jgi:hypothetical protein